MACGRVYVCGMQMGGVCQLMDRAKDSSGCVALSVGLLCSGGDEPGGWAVGSVLSFSRPAYCFGFKNVVCEIILTSIYSDSAIISLDSFAILIESKT